MINRKFTAKQIAALKAEGVSFTVKGRELVVAVVRKGEMRDGLSRSDIDTDATDAQVRKVCEMFPDVGGFCTGWGGWHLRRGYSSATAGYDFNDVASPHHY